MNSVAGKGRTLAKDSETKNQLEEAASSAVNLHSKVQQNAKEANERRTRSKDSGDYDYIHSTFTLQAKHIKSAFSDSMRPISDHGT